MKNFLEGYKITWIVVLVVVLTAFFLFFPKKSLEEKKEEAVVATTKEEILLENSYEIFDVPFIPQAPFAEWDNPIFQDGCEEATSLMVVSWARGSGLDEEEAKKEIIAMSDYQKEKFGEYRDTSSYDTMERIIKGYFGYNAVEVKREIILEDIIDEIEKGNVVIIPANGQLLGNPYFTPPGPERHMVVIWGYDTNSGEFIVNDPGTKRGEKYRYQKEILFKAIRDYPTGYHEPIEEIEKVMIVIGRE